MTVRRSLLLLLMGLGTLVASLIAYRAGSGGSVSGEGYAATGRASTATPPLSVGPSNWLAIPTPDVEFQTLDGGSARLSSYEGGVVILNFWGTWCPPCRAEIPHLVRAQERLADLGGTVIAPAVASGFPEEIRAFAAETGINYPIWIVSDAVAVGRFGARGYPFTMLIGPDGIIRRTYAGPQTEESLLRDVRALLDGEAGGSSPD